MTEERFGQSEPFSLGVEEELMILDAETLEQVPQVELLLQETPHGRLKTELFASVVELNTGVCPDAASVLDAVRALRHQASATAAEHGLAIAAAGTHPLSVPEAQPIAPVERYGKFVDYVGITARRQGVNGLHVHVGMESWQTCLDVLEGLLPWLPVVLALSANSPYLAGAESGMMSVRAEVLAMLPRSGAPPVFSSPADWHAFIERMRATGIPLTTDYTSYWWDARPHPSFGTLEIRMPDQPTSLEMTGALTVLLQALCRTLAEQPVSRPADRSDYQQNRWAAARFGPRARLIHPNGTRSAEVPELFEELLSLVAETTRKLGAESLLSVLDANACEADLQLEVGRGEGLRALCRDLADRTLGSDR